MRMKNETETDVEFDGMEKDRDGDGGEEFDDMKKNRDGDGDGDHECRQRS